MENSRKCGNMNTHIRCKNKFLFHNRNNYNFTGFSSRISLYGRGKMTEREFAERPKRATLTNGLPLARKVLEVRRSHMRTLDGGDFGVTREQLPSSVPQPRAQLTEHHRRWSSAALARA